MMPLARAFCDFPVRAALLVFTVVLGNSALTSNALAESFDKPVRTTVVDLGPSPSQDRLQGSRFRVKLSCSYYPAFMVKELDDDGLKGTRWVTIVPVENGRIPACRRSHGSTERFMAKEWWTFLGAKGSLLFLEAADGDENQGIPFRVLDRKTGKKIFEDSAWWDGHLEFAQTPDGRISLSYLRVVGDDCSIPKGGTSCWNKFTEKFGLPLAAAPKCTNYLGEQTLTAEDTQSRSAIAYPVAVELFPRPSIKAILGPVKCSQE
jgi:hypothetical protein